MRLNQAMGSNQGMTLSAGSVEARPQDRHAASPFAMPAEGWKQVLQRTWREVGEDNVGLAAAGVAFYGFLAIVPLLGAIVLSYGLIADPATVLKDMKGLAAIMPGDAAKLVGDQLMNVVKTSGGRKGFGLALALALALFGARNGASSVIIGLNIAYEEKETRSFVRLNLLALAITAAAVLVAIIALVAIAALGHLEKLMPGAPGIVLVLGKILTYVLVALGGAAGAATLYRYAPNHKKAKWTWLTPGSAVAAVLWMLLTIAFGIYVANFGNYNATYGSLGAVAVTLTWLYLSSYVLLLGAELNSELEHQAAGDASADADKAEPVQPTPAAVPDAPHPLSEPDAGDDLALWRAGRRVRRAIGPDKVGLAPSLLATGGLALVRRRGHATAGFALLAAGGVVALLTAEPAPRPKKPSFSKSRKTR